MLDRMKNIDQEISKLQKTKKYPNNVSIPNTHIQAFPDKALVNNPED